MGTWGTEAFQNDAAADWLAAFERDGLAAVVEVLVNLAQFVGATIQV